MTHTFLSVAIGVLGEKFATVTNDEQNSSITLFVILYWALDKLYI